MYYLSNPPEADYEFLKSRILPGKSEQDISAYYHFRLPFRLQVCSFDPGETRRYYTMTTFDPDMQVHTALERKEAGGFLNGRLHQHDFYELMFLLEGNVYQKIENERHLYTEGSCCLLNKNVRHSEEYDPAGGSFRLLFLQVSEEFLKLIYESYSLQYFEAERTEKRTQLEEFLSSNLYGKPGREKDYVDFIPHKNSDWIVQHMHATFEEMIREMLSPARGSSFRIACMILKILSMLSEKENYSTTPVRIGSEQENILFREITKRMETTNGRISRGELEKELHYSGSHLNRVTRKYTGLSLFEYGTTFSMKEAARLLKESDLSVQEIALQLGFTNRTHFYALFREAYVLSPAAYRKQIRNR